MQEHTSQGPCQKGLSRAKKKPGRKSAQIMSMQRWTDSLYSSPPSSLSSSTPSTGDTSCSVTSYSASNKVISGGTVKWCQVKTSFLSQKKIEEKRTRVWIILNYSCYMFVLHEGASLVEHAWMEKEADCIIPRILRKADLMRHPALWKQSFSNKPFA